MGNCNPPISLTPLPLSTKGGHVHSCGPYHALVPFLSLSLPVRHLARSRRPMAEGDAGWSLRKPPHLLARAGMEGSTRGEARCQRSQPLKNGRHLSRRIRRLVTAHSIHANPPIRQRCIPRCRSRETYLVKESCETTRRFAQLCVSFAIENTCVARSLHQLLPSTFSRSELLHVCNLQPQIPQILFSFEYSRANRASSNRN